MAIDPQHLKAMAFPETRQSYGARECLVYALGVGCGLDRAQPRWLRTAEPCALPTMATVLGYEGFWAERPETGLDAARTLHVGQSLTLHHPLPASATIVRTMRVGDIADRRDRGLLIQAIEEICDGRDDTPIATLESLVYCRGAGGGGGTVARIAAPPPLPDTPAEASRDILTSPQQAWVYSLSGDDNPLHLDPAVAAAAGFERPILQGLSVYGAACAALLALVCDDDAARLRNLTARFTAPVFPGDRLAIELWRQAPGAARFRVVNRSTQRIALDAGTVTWSLPEEAPPP